MHDPIGPMFLGSLSAVFAGYGLRELALAYRTAALKAWSERAIPGAGGIIVAALFAARPSRRSAETSFSFPPGWESKVKPGLRCVFGIGVKADGTTCLPYLNGSVISDHLRGPLYGSFVGLAFNLPEFGKVLFPI
jgi:hypothetical protein